MLTKYVLKKNILKLLKGYELLKDKTLYYETLKKITPQNFLKESKKN